MNLFSVLYVIVDARLMPMIMRRVVFVRVSVKFVADEHATCGDLRVVALSVAVSVGDASLVSQWFSLGLRLQL